MEDILAIIIILKLELRGNMVTCMCCTLLQCWQYSGITWPRKLYPHQQQQRALILIRERFNMDTALHFLELSIPGTKVLIIL